MRAAPCRGCGTDDNGRPRRRAPNLSRTGRGFEILKHPAYPPKPNGDQETRLAQQSSAVGDYDDSFDRPGTSFLWIGDGHHLNRDEVRELARRMNAWLETGSLTDGETK